MLFTVSLKITHRCFWIHWKCVLRFNETGRFCCKNNQKKSIKLTVYLFIIKLDFLRILLIMAKMAKFYLPNQKQLYGETER
jgi:hypothetical protein